MCLRKCLFGLLIAGFLCSFVHAENDRPIIGVLTQPTHGSMTKFGSSYIAASYVKYLEGAGARVVPILHNSTQEELGNLFKSINGVLFPGGGSSLYHTALENAGNFFFQSAIKAFENGDYFPVWGTCMGFELVGILAAGEKEVLSSVDAENITLPLDFTPAAKSSRLFGKAPSGVINTLGTEPVTMNNHVNSISPKTFQSNPGLANRFSILSTNKDRKGTVFVSSMEATKYPIYATQYHPEKPIFEWNPNEVMNHSPTSVSAMQYHSNFLVDEARKSTHAFASADEESAALIYNFSPIYTAKGPNPVSTSFQQCYIF